MWGESKVFNVFADVVIIAAMCALLVVDINALVDEANIVDGEAIDVPVSNVDELMESGEDDE